MIRSPIHTSIYNPIPIPNPTLIPIPIHSPTDSLDVLSLVLLGDINVLPSWLQWNLLDLTQELPRGAERQAKRLWVILLHILQTVVELNVLRE